MSNKRPGSPVAKLPLKPPSLSIQPSPVPQSTNNSSPSTNNSECAEGLIVRTYDYGHPEPGTERWNFSWPPPAQFPRRNWRTAVWSPPNMTANYVTPEVFQLAGKFASVAVQSALDGETPWSEVGTNGIYLALVDLMLQCRDHLRTETCYASIRSATDPSEPGFLTYPQWRRKCKAEMERIFSLAQAVVPEGVMQEITLSKCKHYCTAAILWTFGGDMDAGRWLFDDSFLPPLRHLKRIPVSFLGQYDATPEQLERYGMRRVTGRISLNTCEGDILRRAAANRKRYGEAQPLPAGLSGLPLATPVRAQTGRIPGTNLVVVPLQRRRPA
ncbi:hypothetical protein CC85DRAFT_282580 [Cutaneotrichosporon oleaginosum]|uniref:Uncharacterized protein n=1 Tax=Cutaneotrichosporon oleaginosum TaxID=879819 RepID=A0A0J0XWR5_9TREE|nr:uncharacterized protein CC85DRAFT_282580 [Cutaneotrichosporon oleaginosum]KLT45496.1 hypothetical protein CC85DRAFT_282580 [Cutaneotrichosporon oleaginosum]TXT14549.1 hypothetical protein COLE_00742 [Cutaneotrichosporon oleaginosum]